MADLVDEMEIDKIRIMEEIFPFHSPRDATWNALSPNVFFVFVAL